MEEKDNIPNNWKKVKVKDVCEKILGGGTPSTSVKEYWEGNIPWISSADILGLNDIVPRRKVSKKGIENSAANVLPKGGIIVVTRVSLGKLAVAPYDISFSQDCQGLILNKKIILPEYALIFLSTAVQKFKTQSRGTTINGVTKKQLEELSLLLPPLEEQGLIVSKLEEMLSELDNGIKQIKVVLDQAESLRQSILKKAFEGKLT